MTETPLNTGEHQEFVRRVEEHFDRVDGRLKDIEGQMRTYTQMAVDIKSLAMSTERMAKELESQRERIDEIDERDGKKWRDACAYAVTVIIGLIIGWMFSQFGIVA